MARKDFPPENKARMASILICSSRIWSLAKQLKRSSPTETKELLDFVEYLEHKRTKDKKVKKPNNLQPKKQPCLTNKEHEGFLVLKEFMEMIFEAERLSQKEKEEKLLRKHNRQKKIINDIIPNNSQKDDL